VIDDPAPPESPRAVPPADAVVPRASSPQSPPPLRWLVPAVLVLTIIAAAALAMAWNTQKRVRSLERELVQRQQTSQAEATAAHTLARAAEDSARDAAAKVALLEARVAESSLQRTQLEELIQSLSRSRDETVLGDVEAAIRVAVQQSAITGSAEPLVATLKQAEERLARYNQPRLERVRRAVTRDLERVKAVALSDISTLVIRLDEAVRQVDELPLLAAAEPRRATPARTSARSVPAPAASAPASAPAASPRWSDPIGQAWNSFTERAWEEVRGLVRVTRIENPEAVLAAPEQSFYLRENLKLRLLNARLAVLSRQFDIAQADLRDVQAALDRYFDRSSRRVVAASELVRQVAAQARLVTVPRPDETLAALAAAGQ
jgi:uroporphyrin-3 C-methyltransferase